MKHKQNSPSKNAQTVIQISFSGQFSYEHILKNPFEEEDLQHILDSKGFVE